MSYPVGENVSICRLARHVMKIVLFISAAAILYATSASQTREYCAASGSAVPQTSLINVVQPVVLVLVDFPDGRLADGSLPSQDSDTALVANIDAVGSMGYSDPRMPCRKMIRKYVYEDYWNMFFSTNSYVGPFVHPDYVTHNGYTPIQKGTMWDGQVYDLTVYGSVRDYWAEVSYGNFQIQGAQTRAGTTDMYHNGIVNNIISVNGKNYVRWITVRSAKTSYFAGDTTLIRDAYAKLDQLHALPATDPDHIEFDRSAFTGKIGFITAGGLLGGWAYVGQTEFVVSEKLWGTTNADPSCIVDGITGIAHEFGHTIGFEHMAEGSYDIMHWGGFLDRRYYFCPPHINPLAKLRRHWLTAATNVVGIMSSGEFSIAPITSSNPQVAVATIYGDPGRIDDWSHSEYYVIEYRKREKFNRFAGGPDNQGFGGGALIWHYSRYGSCRSAFTADDQIRSGIDFSLALKVAAYDSGYKGNPGSPSDLFWPGHSTLSDTSTPSSNSMNNYPTGITLNGFSAGSNLTFNAAYGHGSVPAYMYFFRIVDGFPSEGSLPSGPVYVEGYRNSYTLTIGNGVSVDFAPGGGFGLTYVNSSAGSLRQFESGSIRLSQTWDQATPLNLAGNATVTFVTGSQLVLGANVTLTTSDETSLNFEPGSSVRCGSGSSLAVSGTLNASGSSSAQIRFDRSGSSGTWGGILYQPNSQVTLSYCTIKNATYGVYVGYGGSRDDQHPAPAIQNCTIDSNTYGLYYYGSGKSSAPFQNNTISNSSSHGIYMFNSWPQSISGNTITGNGGDGISLDNSRAEIVGNTISGNGMNGIYCYNHSIPNIHDNVIALNRRTGVMCDYYSAAALGGGLAGWGHDLISGNPVNIWAEYSSNMVAGYNGSQGLNSMYGDTSVDAAAGNQSHVVAQFNYWGGTLTPAAWQYNGGTIDFGNALYDDPNARMGVAVAHKNAASGISLRPVAVKGTRSDTNSYAGRDLMALQSDMLIGNYSPAIFQYTQRYKAEDDSSMKQYILTQLGECCLNTTGSDFVGFLNSVVRPGLSKNDPLCATALELETAFFIRDGKLDEAIANYDTLASRFARDTAAVKHALFGLWSLYAHTLRDTDKAGEYLEQLKAEFPDDDLTWHARILSGEIDSSVIRGQEIEKGSTALPGRTELLPNYPNPFNSSTMIRYELAPGGRVTLAVFNTLGQLVTTLVSGEEEPGEHTVKFDGANLASGAYFYRLHAGSFVQVRRLLLIK